jgi:hypothetical protein
MILKAHDELAQIKKSWLLPFLSMIAYLLPDHEDAGISAGMIQKPSADRLRKL